jgi:RNA polymerase sigma-70 factor (ECF subfamily)
MVIETNSKSCGPPDYRARSVHRRVSAPSICPLKIDRSNPKTDLSDDDLIGAISSKDAAAGHLFYVRHRRAVFRFLTGIVHDPSIAEDLVDEIFLNVWRGAGTFQRKAKVTTWLLGIARNKALSVLRGRSHAHLEDVRSSRIPDPTDDPEETVKRKELHSVLRSCCNGLSPAHRQVIDLIYYQDKGVSEVAEITGVPVATVKTRAFYARNRIAEVLRSQGVHSAFR